MKWLKAEKDEVEMHLDITNITPEQKQELLELFSTIDILGGLGSSRSFTVFVDGDGAFRAKIKIDGKDPKVKDLENNKRYKDLINQKDVSYGLD